MAEPDVDAWEDTTMALIRAGTMYAQGGKYDAETDGKFRRVRVAAGALQAALMNINIMPPTVPPIPPAPVQPVTPAPTATPAEAAPETPAPPQAPRVQPRR